ncbi:MAG TPA: tetratricopeptide repeat protein [Aquificae bacterium]|nr:tetratricopeptide repeat protein [Aquificota bacterium]
MRKLVKFLFLLYIFFNVSFALSQKYIDNYICYLYTKRDFINLDYFIKKKIKVEDLFKYKLSNCSKRALGLYFYLQGCYDIALKFFLQIRYYTLADLINLSATYIKKGKYNSAVKLLKLAKIKYGDEKHILMNLAISYIKLGKYEKAREYLLKLLDMDISKDLKNRVLRILNYIGY